MNTTPVINVVKRLIIVSSELGRLWLRIFRYSPEPAGSEFNNPTGSN